MKTRASALLTPESTEALKQLGENIRTARLRRGWSRQILGARVGAHESTIKRLEDGSASTMIGVLAGTLWVLGLVDDLTLLAKPESDGVGLALAKKIQRKRGSAKPQLQEIDNDF